jgi:hypothetical protein
MHRATVDRTLKTAVHSPAQPEGRAMLETITNILALVLLLFQPVGACTKEAYAEDRRETPVRSSSYERVICKGCEKYERQQYEAWRDQKDPSDPLSKPIDSLGVKGYDRSLCNDKWNGCTKFDREQFDARHPGRPLEELSYHPPYIPGTRFGGYRRDGTRGNGFSSSTRGWDSTDPYRSSSQFPSSLSDD